MEVDKLRNASRQDKLDLSGRGLSTLPPEVAQLTNLQVLYEHRKNQLSFAEGQVLRSFRALLFRTDRDRVFGGLRRVQAPAGELLWVCPDHYPEYDPGLPDIPA